MSTPRIVMTKLRLKEISEAVFATTDEHRLQVVHAGAGLSATGCSTQLDRLSHAIWKKLAKALELEKV